MKNSRHALKPSVGSCADSGRVVGIDVGGSNLRVAVADKSGRVLGKWSTSTKRTDSPAMVIEQIRKGVGDLLRQASAPPRSLLSLGVGMPGITLRQSGVVVATSYLKGWRNVPLRSLLESALQVPVVIENDVRLGAIGEHWLGAARGIQDFVFLAIGTGIAAGIFVNGQLLHGSDGTAGEVGYMLVPGVPEAAAKPGAPGSLESVIGGEGIRQQWMQVCNGTRTKLPRNLSPTEIFEYAVARDPLAKTVLDRTARTLAYAIHDISLVLNSSLFVLGGGVGANALLLDATRNVLEQYSTPVPPKLALAGLGQDAQLMGTIRLALDHTESSIGPSAAKQARGKRRRTESREKQAADAHR